MSTRESQRHNVCEVLDIVRVFYFAATAKVPKCNISQHCEVHECKNEIWSACNASTSGQPASKYCARDHFNDT